MMPHDFKSVMILILGIHFSPIAFSYDFQGNTFSLPPVFDWRNISGNNFLPPAYDQGACGSCVAFSVIDVLESKLHIQNKAPGNWYLSKLSRQHAFSCSGGGCKSGIEISKVLDHLKTTGVGSEGCAPYTSGATAKDVPCNTLCQNPKGKLTKIKNYRSPTHGKADVQTIKKSLLNGPLITSMILYEDLYAYKTGIYTHKSGDRLGVHTVTLVGWDDRKSSWIVRNTWGESFGDGGYFYASWEDPTLLIGRYTYEIEIDKNQNASDVAFRGIKPGQVMSGNHPLDVISSKIISNLEWKIHPKHYTYVSVPILSGEFKPTQFEANLNAFSSNLDTSLLEDGEYNLFLSYEDSEGLKINSDPHRVRIKNKAYELDFRLESFEDGIQISGFQKFKFQTFGVFELFDQIVVYFENPNNSKIYKKYIYSVSENTHSNIFTKDIPNGEYSIHAELVGHGQLPISTSYYNIQIEN